MKKRFLYIALACMSVASCRKDNPDIIEEGSIETQNSYDDQAAQTFLQTHYLDAKGNIKNYVETDTANTKLSEMVPAPVKLASGVIYLVRAGAQPDPGTTIGPSDIIKIMSTTNSYQATDDNGKVTFSAGYPFKNTIGGSGVPDNDPFYYYARKAILDQGTTDIEKSRSFYEIEGFREALPMFKAFDIPDESAYNLQGIIIVPSRAAFARDPHYRYNNISYRNRSFVFNFQIYKTTAASDPR